METFKVPECIIRALPPSIFWLCLSLLLFVYWFFTSLATKKVFFTGWKESHCPPKPPSLKDGIAQPGSGAVLIRLPGPWAARLDSLSISRARQQGMDVVGVSTFAQLSHWRLNGRKEVLCLPPPGRGSVTQTKTTDGDR